jgi:hypothetical protein
MILKRMKKALLAHGLSTGLAPCCPPTPFAYAKRALLIDFGLLVTIECQVRKVIRQAISV